MVNVNYICLILKPEINLQDNCDGPQTMTQIVEDWQTHTQCLMVHTPLFDALWRTLK